MEELMNIHISNPTTFFATKTPLRSKSHAINSPQQDVILAFWTKGDIWGEDPKLKGHNP